MTILNWKWGGLLLGAVFFLAVLLVKPIGVSTQFVILDGLIWDAAQPGMVAASETAKSGWVSENAYLAHYAHNVANPLNYSFVFVLAMALGAFLSRWFGGGLAAGERFSPALWRANIPGGAVSRFAAAFVGGFIVLYGARLAGGCTSGHMMSGMMQTAISGYLFTMGAFAAAIPTAMWLYKREA